uniref:Piezo-type mechanosensitive ion channel component 1-like n=1 Tax=Acanthochromis polyacanthus TaxID=80966 RepID=A0A3Q1FWF1_9TELE
TMSVQQQSIQPFAQEDYDNLTKKFLDNAVAMQFITLYSYEDIVTAKIEGSSGSVWRISPPSRQEVIKELLGSPVDLTLRLAWTFQRDLGKGGTVEHTFDKHSIDLEPGNPVRAEMASLLVGNRTEPVLVPHMFPNYIRAPNGAEAKPVSQLYEGQNDEDDYLNITLSLKSDRSLSSSGNQEWWDIAIASCGSSSCGVLPMVIFNDKYHGSLCVCGLGHREVSALCGPHPEALHRHLPGYITSFKSTFANNRCWPVSGANDDQMDSGEPQSRPGQTLTDCLSCLLIKSNTMQKCLDDNKWKTSSEHSTIMQVDLQPKRHTKGDTQ